MARTSVARSPLPTAKPVTPPPTVALRSKLDAAHLAVERLESIIFVSVQALVDQDCDIDSSVATCLEAGVTAELEPARNRIREAMDLLTEVTSHV